MFTGIFNLMDSTYITLFCFQSLYPTPPLISREMLDSTWPYRAVSLCLYYPPLNKQIHILCVTCVGSKSIRFWRLFEQGRIDLSNRLDLVSVWLTTCPFSAANGNIGLVARSVKWLAALCFCSWVMIREAKHVYIWTTNTTYQSAIWSSYHLKHMAPAQNAEKQYVCHCCTAALSTLGYHISPTLSRKCSVYRFLLRVVILDWCLRVILNAPGMVWGCDPGPGLTRTMALGHGLF